VRREVIMPTTEFYLKEDVYALIDSIKAKSPWAESALADRIKDEMHVLPIYRTSIEREER